MMMLTRGGGCGGNERTSRTPTTTNQEDHEQNQQISLLDFCLAALRKSMVSCRVDSGEDMIYAVKKMEIGWPTNVQHIAHVTFDRFQGFLGLPVEFEVEVLCRAPSASISVFGVSAESMQCSFDKSGNSVPTILLLMQERLYTQGGLEAEGIFRINPENGQEEHVRNQINKGIVPDNIDVHCLAGLTKAWFRELPSGVLDGLSPEQVLNCTEEEEFVELVEQLQPTESALLNWGIGLMADVVEHEESNKMNARNIAMVFAPNMTQMSDPLTALMHAVQVMNLLKSLILKTLREREEASAAGQYSPMSSGSSNMQTYEEYDSQREMDTSCVSAGRASDDEVQSPYSSNTSCESAGLASDNEVQSPYFSNTRDNKYELESLSDSEESYLKQLDDNENARNNFCRKLEGIFCKDGASPSGRSPFLCGGSTIEESGEECSATTAVDADAFIECESKSEGNTIEESGEEYSATTAVDADAFIECESKSDEGNTIEESGEKHSATTGVEADITHALTESKSKHGEDSIQEPALIECESIHKEGMVMDVEEQSCPVQHSA